MATDSFVYCWTDHKTNKLYVGSHKGDCDDGYICSSKLMLEQYNERPKDFTRQIIAKGEYKDIRNLEYLILQSVDAKSNKDFYNQHNGNGDFYCKGHTKKTIDQIQINCKRPDGTDKRSRLGEENGMYGKKHSIESIYKIKLKSGHWKNKKHSEETKIKMKKKKPEYFTTPKGKFWWNDGQKETQNKTCPGEGWKKGRLPKKGLK